VTRTDLDSVVVISAKQNHRDYKAVHRYIERRKPRPDFCERIGCDKGPVQLSNKDHKYSLNLDDWWYLCKSCHITWDYRCGFRTHGFQNGHTYSRRRTVVATATNLGGIT
jgi:hypothetical protein